MTQDDDCVKYSFDNIYNNITNTFNGVLHLKKEEPTKESVEADGYIDPWGEVIDIDPKTFDLGLGYCLKFQDNTGCRGIIIATLLGNVIIDQRLPGHNILRVSAPKMMKTLFNLETIGIKQMEFLFGKSAGLCNKNVVDLRIKNLNRAIDSRKQNLEECNPQGKLFNKGV